MPFPSTGNKKSKVTTSFLKKSQKPYEPTKRNFKKSFVNKRINNSSRNLLTMTEQSEEEMREAFEQFMITGTSKSRSVWESPVAAGQAH